MPKAKFKSVTLTPEQDQQVKELAQSIYGIKHGNKTRFVREAVDEKIEREINKRQIGVEPSCSANKEE